MKPSPCWLCMSLAFSKDSKNRTKGSVSFTRLQGVGVSFPSVTHLAPRSWAAVISNNTPDCENVLTRFPFCVR